MGMTAEEEQQLIRDRFPTLRFSAFEITSPATKQYNCIAWAAEESHQWWWPSGPYWPDGVPKEEVYKVIRTPARGDYRS